MESHRKQYPSSAIGLTMGLPALGVTHEHRQSCQPCAVDHRRDLCCGGGRHCSDSHWPGQRREFPPLDTLDDHALDDDPVAHHEPGYTVQRDDIRRQLVGRHVRNRDMVADVAFEQQRQSELSRRHGRVMTGTITAGTITAEAERVYSLSLRAIGTHVRLLTPDATVLDAARVMLADRLESLDRVASRFRTDSELAQINRASRIAAGEGRDVLRLSVSQELAELLAHALEVESLTGGLATPTVGNALIAAGYDADIDAVRHRAGTTRSGDRAGDADAHSECVLQGSTLTVSAGATLDLGSSAKAFAAHQWSTEIAGRVGAGILLDLGGDLAYAGPSPSGGWRVGVVDWTGTTRQVVVADGGQSFATSSTKVRVWQTGQRRRHHIIDPRTGSPARTPWAQVTCACAATQWANAASTASVILGVNAPEWLSDRGIPALLIAHNGAETRVAGWPPATATDAGAQR